jgi:phosphorylcholine metabolism protein LicD
MVMKNFMFQLLEETIHLCENAHISYWVVGGFAVDAKKGKISREHEDIDLCIHEKNIDECLKLFCKNGFRITKEGMKYVFYKSGAKIDIFVLFEKCAYYERKREWFNALYPKELFDNMQILTLNGLTFKVPSNEGLRYYGSKTSHPEDTLFTNSLPFDDSIYSRITYTEFAEYQASKKGVLIEELTFD